MVAPSKKYTTKRAFALFALLLWLPTATQAAGVVRLLHVSYDPTREFYRAYNTEFAAAWAKQHGQEARIQQSHGGSGKQARAVIDGLPADIVSLALAYDLDTIAARTHALPSNWQRAFPNRSTPFTSTIVFLVRKGNPKHIANWDDLVKEGVQVITPNPKTSGGARWNYLAAWAYALDLYKGDETKAEGFMQTLYQHVPVLDAGARAATTTFAQRGMGDVLITWENEAHLAVRELGADALEIVVPPFSIMAEPPVAMVEKNAKAHGTEAVARAYVEGLYAPEAQALAARYFYRPTNPAVLEQNAALFPAIRMKRVDELGGWAAVHAKHFADGGMFDRMYQPPER